MTIITNTITFFYKMSSFTSCLDQLFFVETFSPANTHQHMPCWSPCETGLPGNITLLTIIIRLHQDKGLQLTVQSTSARNFPKDQKQKVSPHYYLVWSSSWGNRGNQWRSNKVLPSTAKSSFSFRALSELDNVIL